MVDSSLGCCRRCCLVDNLHSVATRQAPNIPRCATHRNSTHSSSKGSKIVFVCNGLYSWDLLVLSSAGAFAAVCFFFSFVICVDLMGVVRARLQPARNGFAIKNQHTTRAAAAAPQLPSSQCGLQLSHDVQNTAAAAKAENPARP